LEPAASGFAIWTGARVGPPVGGPSVPPSRSCYCMAYRMDRTSIAAPECMIGPDDALAATAGIGLRRHAKLQE